MIQRRTETICKPYAGGQDDRESIIDKIVEAIRLGVTMGEIERELRHYEFKLKKGEPERSQRIK
jgi:hypothetical protein